MNNMINIEELYKDVLLDHYSNPRHTHVIPNPTVTAEGHNPVCGDEIHLSLQVDAEDIIQKVSVQTHGCSISVASGSIMAEELQGKTIEQAQMVIDLFQKMMSGGPVVESESGDFEALVGVKQFPVRIKCALLAWMTLDQAMKQYQGEHVQVVSTEQEGAPF